MQDFEQLKVWQEGQALALDIYRLTAQFPSEERFGLTSQLRRAAVSVPTNIAEGSSRRGQNDFARFLNIAESSAAETKSLLLLARDLGFVSRDVIEEPLQRAARLGRQLQTLRARVEASPDRRPTTDDRKPREPWQTPAPPPRR